jgi:hypothetical protein
VTIGRQAVPIEVAPPAPTKQLSLKEDSAESSRQAELATHPANQGDPGRSFFAGEKPKNDDEDKDTSNHISQYCQPIFPKLI